MIRLSQRGGGSGSAASREQRAGPTGSLGLLSSWAILAALGGRDSRAGRGLGLWEVREVGEVDLGGRGWQRDLWRDVCKL